MDARTAALTGLRVIALSIVFISDWKEALIGIGILTAALAIAVLLYFLFVKMGLKL